MTEIGCPSCGQRREVDEAEVIETRTVGVTDDWATWNTVTCSNCKEGFMYRID